ncbi:MAG: hypothetical protein KKE49_03160, partial [Proteobacteria bacterium]|nr:hypothetical protein [Pseudomonadota bacterium]
NNLLRIKSTDDARSGEDPFQYWRRYYYETGIKLRQGIGRLIRSEADRGMVVILDARYLGHETSGGIS